MVLGLLHLPFLTVGTYGPLLPGVVVLYLALGARCRVLPAVVLALVRSENRELARTRVLAAL